MQLNNFWVCQKFWAIDCEHLFSLFEWGQQTTAGLSCASFDCCCCCFCGWSCLSVCPLPVLSCKKRESESKVLFKFVKFRFLLFDNTMLREELELEHNCCWLDRLKNKNAAAAIGIGPTFPFLFLFLSAITNFPSLATLLEQAQV